MGSLPGSSVSIWLLGHTSSRAYVFGQYLLVTIALPQEKQPCLPSDWGSLRQGCVPLRLGLPEEGLCPPQTGAP